MRAFQAGEKMTKARGHRTPVSHVLGWQRESEDGKAEAEAECPQDWSLEGFQGSSVDAVCCKML